MSASGRLTSNPENHSFCNASRLSGGLIRKTKFGQKWSEKFRQSDKSRKRSLAMSANEDQAVAQSRAGQTRNEVITPKKRQSGRLGTQSSEIEKIIEARNRNRIFAIDKHSRRLQETDPDNSMTDDKSHPSCRSYAEEDQIPINCKTLIRYLCFTFTSIKKTFSM